MLCRLNTCGCFFPPVHPACSTAPSFCASSRFETEVSRRLREIEDLRAELEHQTGVTEHYRGEARKMAEALSQSRAECVAAQESKDAAQAKMEAMKRNLMDNRNKMVALRSELAEAQAQAQANPHSTAEDVSELSEAVREGPGSDRMRRFFDKLDGPVSAAVAASRAQQAAMPPAAGKAHGSPSDGSPSSTRRAFDFSNVSPSPQQRLVPSSKPAGAGPPSAAARSVRTKPTHSVSGAGADAGNAKFTKLTTAAFLSSKPIVRRTGSCVSFVWLSCLVFVLMVFVRVVRVVVNVGRLLHAGTRRLRVERTRPGRRNPSKAGLLGPGTHTACPPSGPGAPQQLPLVHVITSL